MVGTFQIKNDDSNSVQLLTASILVCTIVVYWHIFIHYSDYLFVFNPYEDVITQNTFQTTTEQPKQLNHKAERAHVEKKSNRLTE